MRNFLIVHTRKETMKQHKFGKTFPVCFEDVDHEIFIKLHKTFMIARYISLSCKNAWGRATA